MPKLYNTTYFIVYLPFMKPLGHGPWMLFKEITVKPGEKFKYQFTEKFQARWIRFVADKNCYATAWLIYN